LHRQSRNDGETGQTVAGKTRRSQGTIECALLIEVSASKFHQGQKQIASHKVRMYGCNLYLLKIID